MMIDEDHDDDDDIVDEDEIGGGHGDDDDDEDDDRVNTASKNDGRISGAYNPSDFDSLAVEHPQVRRLFDHITAFSPAVVPLPTKLMPFVPDYIPSIGDIDAFIKIPPPSASDADEESVSPDGGDLALGLGVLDEPCGRQSDPNVLRLQLRALDRSTTSSGRTDAAVRRRSDAVGAVTASSGDTARAIDKWIRDIGELHRCKPAPAVHYTRPMPDLEVLMQEWPSALEEALSGGSSDQQLQLPSAELDCSLETFVDVWCAILGVPVYGRRVHSLHLIFSLFSTFAKSQHFGGARDFQ